MGLVPDILHGGRYESAGYPVTGSFRLTHGTYTIRVAGGGADGGVGDNSGPGWGGASGGWAQSTITIPAGASYMFSVTAGAGFGPNSGNINRVWSISRVVCATLGVNITCTGGTPHRWQDVAGTGWAWSHPNSWITDGSGGIATDGQININGQAASNTGVGGQCGIGTGMLTVDLSVGNPILLSGGGAAQTTPGEDGNLYGAGGGGGTRNQSRGPGTAAPGCVYIFRS